MKNNTYNLVLVYLMAGVFILVLLPLSSAETYAVNQKIDLKFTCTLNDAIPSSSATYNISVDYPNGTTFISNSAATSQGQGTFNFTTTFPVIGTYILHSYCYDSTYSFSNSEEIYVTPNGTQLSTSQGIIYFLFLIAAAGLFGICLYYSIHLPWKNMRDDEGNVISVNDLKYVKLFMICMTYLILLLLFGLLRGITANYVPEIGVSGMFEIGYWIMLSAMYPLIVSSLLIALIIWFNDKKFKDALMRGLAIQ